MKLTLTCTGKVKSWISLRACDDCSPLFDNETCEGSTFELCLWHALGRRHSHKLVRTAIVKEPLAPTLCHSFHEHHVRNLPGLLPFLFRLKNRFMAAV